MFSLCAFSVSIIDCVNTDPLNPQDWYMWITVHSLWFFSTQLRTVTVLFSSCLCWLFFLCGLKTRYLPIKREKTLKWLDTSRDLPEYFSATGHRNLGNKSLNSVLILVKPMDDYIFYIFGKAFAWFKSVVNQVFAYLLHSVSLIPASRKRWQRSHSKACPSEIAKKPKLQSAFCGSHYIQQNHQRVFGIALGEIFNWD